MSKKIKMSGVEIINNLFDDLDEIMKPKIAGIDFTKTREMIDLKDYELVMIQEQDETEKLYAVCYWATAQKRRFKACKIVSADGVSDAIKKASIWKKIIFKVVELDKFSILNCK